MVEGIVAIALNAKASRQEVEILVRLEIALVRKEMAEKIAQGNVEYLMHEYIDFLAAPGFLVEEAGLRHTELLGDIARIKQGLSEAISSFSTNIDERLARAAETGNQYQQEKLKNDVGCWRQRWRRTS